MFSLLLTPKVTPYTLSPTTTARSSPSPATPSTLARVASPFSTIIKAFKKLTFTGQSKEEEDVPARWERDDCDIEVKVRSVAYEEKEDFGKSCFGFINNCDLADAISNDASFRLTDDYRRSHFRSREDQDGLGNE